MVFSGLYPTDNDDFEQLRDALEKLALNDSSLSVGAISALTMRSMSIDGSESIKQTNGIDKLFSLYANNAETKQFIDVLRVNCS